MAILVKSCIRLSDGAEFPYDPALEANTTEWKVVRVDAEPRIAKAREVEKFQQQEKIKAAEEKLKRQRERAAAMAVEPMPKPAPAVVAAKPEPPPPAPVLPPPPVPPAPVQAPAPKPIEVIAAEAHTAVGDPDPAPAENHADTMYAFDPNWPLSKLKQFAAKAYPGLQKGNPNKHDLLVLLMKAADAANAK